MNEVVKEEDVGRVDRRDEGKVGVWKRRDGIPRTVGEPVYPAWNFFSAPARNCKPCIGREQVYSGAKIDACLPEPDRAALRTDAIRLRVVLRPAPCGQQKKHTAPQPYLIFLRHGVVS